MILGALGHGHRSSHRRRSRHCGHENGQALVEFAVILPVLLLVLLAAIDFGRLFFLYIGLNDAAREGAAYGANQPADVTGIQTHVKSELGLQPTDTSVTIPAPACSTICASQPGNATANTITVSVNETGGFKFLTPLINNIFGGSLPIGASATAVIQ
ncbi:MAG: TadE/TadG family type IV pilus assembly protein [Acidimicrobiales bacterium]